MSARSCVTKDSEAEPPLVRAVQYVRMSTEHQKYSTRNQADTIAVYAARHGFRIVRTYADKGRSGLAVARRDALQRLIDDVTGGRADFEAILVYDISRWGRFQDIDESAHYEFLCRNAGIAIHYCAEQFANDGSLAAVILKHLKRVMAAEYIRELSTKVHAGQSRLAGLGYRQGGVAGFGLRRCSVDAGGQTRLTLEHGDYKSLHSDRVILVPGPRHEIETVRRIYRMYVTDRMSLQAIANLLNAEGVSPARAARWSRPLVSQILRNEKYIGDHVFNRESNKSGSKRSLNPRASWVRVEGAFEAIVDPRQFAAARRISEKRAPHPRLSDEEMLARLIDLWKRCGGLSKAIIERSKSVPALSTYREHFGSMAEIYARIGYVPASDFPLIWTNAARRRQRPDIVANVVEAVRRCGARVRIEPESGLLIVNGRLRLSIVIARHSSRKNGRPDWHLRFETGLCPDFTLCICLAAGNCEVEHYLLLPRQVYSRPGLVRITKKMMVGFSDHRSRDLQTLIAAVA